MSSMPPRIFTIGVTIQPDGNGEAPPAVDPDADAAASSANAMTRPSLEAMRRVWGLLVRKASAARAPMARLES